MTEAILGTIFMALASGVAWWAGEDYFQRGLDFIEADFRLQLRRLRRNSSRLRAWLIGWCWIVLLEFFVVGILLEAPVFALLGAGLLVAGPWYVLRRMAEHRRMKLEDQLADAMVGLSSAIRAGLSLGQALEILAEQSPRPIREEFRQIVGEFQLGRPLENCLTEARDRLRSENFALFAAALLASRESGGRVNETVERIAHSVIEMQRVERKITAETAQARTSAIYMAIAPSAILAMYYMFIDPINTERLFTTVPGQLMLSAALILNVIAYLWARKILSPDI